MSETASLSLPLIVAEQAQKHVTHNEALRALDAIVQTSAKDRGLATPPGSPADGDRYVVAATATDEWAGHEDEIAAWQDGAWAFYAPREGWRCWVDDEDVLLVHDGAGWVDYTTAISVLQNLSRLGVGTTADATNPFAAKLNKALWTALTTGEGGDGDLRYTLNKEAAGDVLSLLMQSGFSGRAEIGLIGDDDLSFKVSPDGSAWSEAMRIDKNTGEVDFPSGSAAVAKAGDTMTGALVVSASSATSVSVDGAFFSNSTQQTLLDLQRNDDGIFGPVMVSYHNSTAPDAPDSLLLFQGRGNTTTGSDLIYGNFSCRITDATGGAHSAQWRWDARDGGSYVLLFTVDGTDGALFGRNVSPMTDDAYDLGTASLRWDDIHATNGTIQTSDAADKEVRGGLTAAEIAAGGRMGAVVFRWLSAIAEKGEAARAHVGFVAQAVRDALAAEGLDPRRYALFIETPLFERRTRVVTKEVTRPKVREVEKEVERVEVRDGTPVRVTETVTGHETVGAWKPLEDENGAPVVKAISEAKPKEAVAAVVKPVMHFVPELETVTEETEVEETVPALDEKGEQRTRLGLRMTELLAFLDACRRAEMAALQRRVAALEAASG